MKRAIAIALITAGALAAQAGRTLADMEPVLAQIAAYEHGQSSDPQARFSDFVRDSMPSPQLLRQIEARLLKFLQSNATAAGKEFAFRELSLFGTDASVPVLAPMLANAETAEWARYALANIPGPKADEALRQALGKTDGRVKVGIINSLDRRRDSKAVPALAALLSPSTPPEIAAAAAAALGDIATRPALDALASARGKVSGATKERVSEAYVACADQFARRGDKADAARAYRQLLAPGEPRTVRIPALAGLAATEGRAAAPVLTGEIEGQDPECQAAAIRFLSGIPDPEITEVLIKEFPKLAPAGQVRVLTALAVRGDQSARPLAMTAAKSGDAAVRTAALAALGRLGDSSSVAVLAEAAAAGPGPMQNAARQSLYGMRGAGVDAAIVEAIGSASGAVKAELIAATGDRGTLAAADVLTKAVQDPDPAVHREALRALKNVAGPAQVPALVDLLLKASSSSERRDAAQTLASVVKRSQPAPVEAVVSAYKATSAVEPKLSLLQVMGDVSSDQALPLVRGGLHDSDRQIARAAILALSGWETSVPMPDLLSVAKGGSDPALQVLALRGYVKLLSLPSQRPVPESARLLGEAMQLAKATSERRMVLSLLPTYPCKESLELAQASLNDQAVSREAKAAIGQINDAMKLK